LRQAARNTHSEHLVTALGANAQLGSDWLAAEHSQLHGSLARFVGSEAYDIGMLRDDLARFTFLLGVNDGEHLFSPEALRPSAQTWCPHLVTRAASPVHQMLQRVTSRLEYASPEYASLPVTLIGRGQPGDPAQEAGVVSAELLAELAVQAEQFPHRHRTAAGRGQVLVCLR
jgi:hypothetical protein